MDVDFGRTARDYARHRAGFPASLFERLAERQLALEGQVVVDLGTGTGSLARGFAGRGAKVVGVDIAPPLLVEARRLGVGASGGVAHVRARAEAIPFAAGSIDVVTAGQCWHWFDRSAATREVERVLKPGGWLVVCYLDWLPVRENVAELTERLILAHQPSWQLAGGSGFHPDTVRDLDEARFRSIETFSYDVDIAYTHEAWRGRIRASAGVGGSMVAADVEDFDAALETLLCANFPEATLRIPHRIFVVLARPPSTRSRDPRRGT